MNRSKTTRGFTLVEMLVAMAVFSLLASAAAGLLGVSLRNADTFDRADTATRELQIARTIMRADFAQVARRAVRDAYGAATPAVFAGGAAPVDKPIVAFVRHGWDNPGGAEDRASLQYVEYVMDGETLVRRSRPYLDPTPETPVTSATLLSDIRTAQISFLSRGQWSDRWIATATQRTLPDAVALDITRGGADQIRQAFLVGAP